MASARLRKTFKYPSDDEDSGGASRDEMDEEGKHCHLPPPHNLNTHQFLPEQENIISSLQTKSTTSNQAYIVVFSLMPLSLTPLFAYYLFFSTALPARLRLLSLLALTSLLASSFTMFFLSSISGLDARERLDKRQRQMHRNTIASPATTKSIVEMFSRVMDKLDDVRLDLDAEGPLLRALPLLNAVMCGLLLLAGWIVKGQASRNVPVYMWMYFMLPGLMWGMTTVARKSIMDEQKELRELKGMKYGYKGA